MQKIAHKPAPICLVSGAQVYEEFATGCAADHDTLPAGVPLHIRVTRTARLRIGPPVGGVLTGPIFLHDSLALPANTIIRGTVTAYAPIDRILLIKARLNGDLTPVHNPVVAVTQIQPPGTSQSIPISSRGTIHDTHLVRFLAHRSRPSLLQHARGRAHAELQSVRDTFLPLGKKDRALRLVYLQIPPTLRASLPARTYAVAKSICFRYLDRGHQVTFPRDTEAESSSRQTQPPDHSLRKARR